MNPLNKTVTKLKNAFWQTGWHVKFLIAVTVAVGLFYIWQVNMAATRGYVLRDLEAEIKTIEHQNERLQAKVSQLRSIDSVKTRMQMLGLVHVGGVQYVSASDTAVALVNRE